MPAEELKRPDEAAMFRILARHPYSPEGVILRLAWQEGLSRKELNELTWDQVDLDGGSILLPDRAVPLEPSVADCLRERYARYRKLSNRVLIADRGKKPMTPENVSRLAKNVLDSEGQDVSLKDLRRDWIVRQIKSNGWACAARVSGMAVGSLRGIFPAALWEDAPQPDVPQTGDDTEYSLWRIVQQEGSSPAGLALWMGWQLRMQQRLSHDVQIQIVCIRPEFSCQQAVVNHGDNLWLLLYIFVFGVILYFFFVYLAHTVLIEN